MNQKEYDIKFNEFEIRLLIDVLYPHVRWGTRRQQLYDKLIKTLGYKNHHFETVESEKERIENEIILKKYNFMPDLTQHSSKSVEGKKE